jgi:hypothetical protein
MSHGSHKVDIQSKGIKEEIEQEKEENNKENIDIERDWNKGD